MVPFSVDTAIEFKLIIRVPAKYLEQRINIRLAADIPWLLTALASACPLDSAPVLLCGRANGNHLLDGMNQELNVVITGHPFHTGHTELHFALLEGYSRDSLLLEHDLKNAPHLEIVIDALEKQVDLLTEGIYQKFAATHENLKALKEIVGHDHDPPYIDVTLIAYTNILTFLEGWSTAAEQVVNLCGAGGHSHAE